MSRQTIAISMTFVFAAILTQTALACPFCSAVSQTFTEEIQSMDAVVIAKLVQPPTPIDKDDAQSVPKARFEILQVIRGADAVAKQTGTIETVYFGREKVGKRFLLMAVDPPRLMWSTPLPLSDRAEKYVAKIVTLPEKGTQRLKFFLDHLEDKDEMLARDAYDEFAKTPYDDVKAIRSSMDHDQLVKWVSDPNIPASRRRLYFTMLGVCGGKEDVELLETMLQSSDRKTKAGLDSMIACYLTLRGEDGLPLIVDLFLKNKKAEYADTYAAIMALRFHGGQADVVPREKILKALHHMLERPQLADLVIPDLAGWEDWSQIERLVKLFKEADEKSSWVKVPVINYLRACPSPEAKKQLELLKKIDPAAVKRANTFFPLGTPKKTAKPESVKSSQVTPKLPASLDTESVQTLPVATSLASTDDTLECTSANEDALAEPKSRQPETDRTETAAFPAGTPTSIPATHGVEVAHPGSPILAQASPNHWLMGAVALSIGTVMLWVMWTILSGAGQRSPY